MFARSSRKNGNNPRDPDKTEPSKDEGTKQLLNPNSNYSSTNYSSKPKEQSQSIPEKHLDEFGFIVNMDSHGRLFFYPPGGGGGDDGEGKENSDDAGQRTASTQLTKKREQKWRLLQTQWDATTKRRKKLLKHLRRGLPSSQRGTVWSLLGKVPTKIDTATASYQALVKQSMEDTATTEGSDSTGASATTANRTKTDASMIDSNTSGTKSFRRTQETIERDIHRTYPRHSMFHDDDYEVSAANTNDSDVSQDSGQLNTRKLDKLHHHRPDHYQGDLINSKGGQASLRRVLRAYSVYDPDVGYCQGMNFITGMFITVMSEEESFWLLVAAMNDPPCHMRGLFGEGMRETHQVLFIADQLMKQFLPKLYKHLELQTVHITMYATQWLLTVYTSTFPFDLVTRVWDAFLGEGWKIVYRVMLALLQDSQSRLLELEFEDILGYFRDLPKHVNGENIMETAMKIPLRRKHIAKYTKDYEKQQRKEK